MAQQKSQDRRNRGCILERDLELREFVLIKLQCHYWTPEQIAGFLKFRQKELSYVSHATIYAWIYRGPQKKEKLWKFLPRHKAKRGSRESRGARVNRIPNRTSIHDRPKVVAKRKEFGHWEGDLMAFMKNSQHIVELRERKTMFTLSAPLPSKRAEDTSKIILRLREAIPKDARKQSLMIMVVSLLIMKRFVKNLG